MAQTVPAITLPIGSASGLAMGYRVLNLDGTTYSAFTTANVVEFAARVYLVTNGIVAPDAGAYVIWGISGTDMGAGGIDPI